eukprot:12864037-Prorocentrum_lima.AAC.1
MKNFEHGFTNPAAGRTSIPVTNKEVAQSEGATLLEWVESIKSELKSITKGEGLREVTPKDKALFKRKDATMQDCVC